MAIIVFGVYSAKTANINVSGSVGFIAHDCMVEISGTYSCFDPDTGDAITDASLWDASFVVGGKTSSEIAVTKTIDQVFTFSDLNGSASESSDGVYNQTVSITLKVVNKSDFSIDVTTSSPTLVSDAISSYVTTAVDNSEISLVKSGECYITYSFTLKIGTDTVEIDSLNGGYSIGINFNKGAEPEIDVFDIGTLNLKEISSDMFEGAMGLTLDIISIKYDGLKLVNGATLKVRRDYTIGNMVIVIESGTIDFGNYCLTIDEDAYILINGENITSSVIVNAEIIMSVENAIRVQNFNSSSVGLFDNCRVYSTMDDSVCMTIKSSELTFKNCTFFGKSGDQKVIISLKKGSKLYTNSDIGYEALTVEKDSTSSWYNNNVVQA